jgi:Family of unknown function (DUF6491)
MMRKTGLCAVTLICAAAFASFAFAEGEPLPVPDTPACAPANRIRSWSEIDDRHIYLMMQDKRRRFLVTFLGPCKEAKWATIVQLARGSVGKCLWAGDQLVFRRMPMDLGEACWIDKIEPAPLSAEEEAARDRAWSKKPQPEAERPPAF